MKRSRFLSIPFVVPFAVLLSLSAGAPALARDSDSESREMSLFTSGNGNLLFLTAGVVLPMVQGSSDSRTNSARTIDALVKSVVASEGLKLLFREKRPDSNHRDSFPSGHTPAAFAVATVQSKYNPDESFLWYAGATAVGVSRVTLNRHYVHDVLAGAALGYFVGRDSLSGHHRVTFLPEYSSQNHVVGVALHMEF